MDTANQASSGPCQPRLLWLPLNSMECGISQQWLAQQAGLSKQALYAIETGEVDPRASRVAKIAKALRVTSDYLLGLKDTEELGDMVRPLAVA